MDTRETYQGERLSQRHGEIFNGSNSGVVCDKDSSIRYSNKGNRLGRPRSVNPRTTCTVCGNSVGLRKSRCLKCLAAYKRDLRAKNPEKYRAYLREWYRLNPEKAKANARRNYLRHKERFIANAKKWSSMNREKRIKQMTFQNAKRKSRTRANGGRGFTKKHWNKLLMNTNGLCCYCRQSEARSIDHFYPISKGGEHDWFNIVPACRLCNSRKRENDPLMWVMDNFGHTGWNYVQSIKLPSLK